jgi:hypothetical protein
MFKLYRETYRGWNVKHFHEHLTRDHGFRCSTTTRLSALSRLVVTSTPWQPSLLRVSGRRARMVSTNCVPVGGIKLDAAHPSSGTVIKVVPDPMRSVGSASVRKLRPRSMSASSRTGRKVLNLNP